MFGCTAHLEVEERAILVAMGARMWCTQAIGSPCSAGTLPPTPTPAAPDHCPWKRSTPNLSPASASAPDSGHREQLRRHGSGHRLPGWPYLGSLVSRAGSHPRGLGRSGPQPGPGGARRRHGGMHSRGPGSGRGAAPGLGSRRRHRRARPQPVPQGAQARGRTDSLGLIVSGSFMHQACWPLAGVMSSWSLKVGCHRRTLPSASHTPGT